MDTDAIVVSQFVGEGPPRPGEIRKISGGPLYAADDVLDLLDSDFPAVEIWTRKCRLDVQNWKLKDGEVYELIRIAVDSLDHYHASEWCLQESDGSWAACDAYRVHWEKPHAKIKPGMKFYVKFAIDRMGKLLLVSCHPSKERRQWT